MLFRVFLASATIAFGAMSAQAQTAGSWTGFNLAIGGGAGKVDASLTSISAYDLRNEFEVPAPDFFRRVISGRSEISEAQNQWSGFGTAAVGYDLAFGTFVLGAFADIDLYDDETKQGSTTPFQAVGTLESSFQVELPVTRTIGSTTTSFELERVWSIGGKLGYLATPNLLLYGVAGYSQASIDGQTVFSFRDTTFSGVVDRTLTAKLNDELDGYFIGAGGEWKMSEICAIRLEYRFADYDGKSNSADFASAGTGKIGGVNVANNTSASARSDIDLEIHTVRAALVFKLGTFGD